MRDAGTRHPLKGRKASELQPQSVDVKGILAIQQRRIAIRDARSDQTIRRQVCVRSREAIAFKAVGRLDPNADNSPVRD